MLRRKALAALAWPQKESADELNLAVHILLPGRNRFLRDHKRSAAWPANSKRRAWPRLAEITPQDLRCEAFLQTHVSRASLP